MAMGTHLNTTRFRLRYILLVILLVSLPAMFADAQRSDANADLPRRGSLDASIESGSDASGAPAKLHLLF